MACCASGDAMIEIVIPPGEILIRELGPNAYLITVGDMKLTATREQLGQLAARVHSLMVPLVPSSPMEALRLLHGNIGLVFATELAAPSLAGNAGIPSAEAFGKGGSIS